MSKRAEEAIRSKEVNDAANDYCSAYYDWHNKAEREAVVSTFKQGYFEGYEQAEKDIITLIESRIAEILGDAQPKPALRAELQDIIKRIKEEEA